MRTLRKVGGAAVVVALLSGSVAALAEEGGVYRGTVSQQEACTSDVFRLCWSEVPNVSAIVGCLKRERLRLSPECREVFQQPPTQVAHTPAAASKRFRRHRQVSAD
jgi:hypothetical protein